MNARSRRPSSPVRRLALAAALPIALMSSACDAPLETRAARPANPRVAAPASGTGAATTASTSETAKPADAGVDFGDSAYVGRDRCQPCHQGNYATFLHTGMGRSMYAMTPDRVIEDWTEDNTLLDLRTGVRYRMVERDGSFYQQQFVLDRTGRPIAFDEKRLAYAVGSANHSRGYIVREADGGLFQAPVCWDPTNAFWMLCPGFETKNDNFTRETSYTCLFCHNGRVEPVPGTRNRYEEPMTLGIGCERCHGPGERHIAFREDPENFWAEAGHPGDPIVNPRRLPDEERQQVCFQCHLGDTAATVRVFRHGRSLADYRPGMKIGEVLVPFRYSEPSQWDFSLVAQADRMLLSKCWTESGGKLECLTCHNPHVTVYSKEPGSFRDNCRTCHELDDCSAPMEKRNATTSAPDDCVTCHMRKAVTSDRKYALFTDHWIRKDIDLKERDVRTNWDLEPIFEEEFARFPPGERAYYVGRANFLRAVETGPSTQRRLLSRALPAFREALALGFDEADAHFFLGKTLTYLGRWKEAEPSFRRALARDPGSHDAQFALGQTLAALGRLDEAAAVFDRMLQSTPDDPMALAERGRVHVAKGRPEEAIRDYRRAVAAEPWNAMLHVNLGMTLASTGDFAGATEAGRTAVRLDPDADWTWDFLAKAAAAAGSEAEAAEAARQRDARRAPP